MGTDLGREPVPEETTIRKFRHLMEKHNPGDQSFHRVNQYLTEGNYLKRAAVLLFHQDPEQFITGAFVKIGFFRSESDLAYHDEVHGGLFSQLKNTVDFLRTKCMNALVHRDYAVPAPIQIRVYADKLNIWNPAALQEGWTLEKLLGEHSSHPFNPDVANVFFRASEIEAWERGIERIFSACRNADSPKPRVRLSGNDLWFKFSFSPAYLDRVAGGAKGKTPVKMPDLILHVLETNPDMTLKRNLETMHLFQIAD